MKKVLSIILIAMLIISTAFSSDPYVNAAGKNAVVTVKNAKVGSKVTIGDYIYKITDAKKKNSTVMVVGLTKKAKKRVTKIVIPDTVRIKSKKGKNKGTFSYKVTGIGEKAFRNNKKITEVSIGKNVEVIWMKAFENCKKLKKVTFAKNSRLEKIKDAAFRGCKKLSKFSFKNLKNLKSVAKTAFIGTKIKKVPVDEIVEATDYTYEVYPLIAPFNDMFYIKTDNPDPNSFRLYDKSSAYDKPVSTTYKKDGSIDKEIHNCSIQVRKYLYPDVVYVDKDKYRVKGGYIGESPFGNVDGGVLTLQQATRVNSLVDEWSDTGYEDTKVKIKMSAVYDTTDYLIETFGKKSNDFFGKMSDIQSGFSKMCLYSGASIRGELVKSEKYPYYGISNSPHVDQDFYIQDPYSRKGGKRLLVSDMHPMRYDSLGFPGILSSVAKKLNPNVQVAQNSDSHYTIDVTLNGTTKQYGGAGSGGGQSITENMIKYYFKFDGSASDAWKDITYDKASDMLREYGKLEVPDDIPTEDKLTWAQVRQTVGKGGSYVKIIGLYSIFGSTGDEYTFLYDNGNTYEGSNGRSGMGYFSNAWYDGRYYNRHETIEQGTKFGEKSKKDGTDTGKAAIVVKDAVIKVPQDGKKYMYNYSDLSKQTNYNAETGVWSGFTFYRYDEATGTWIADVKSRINYRDDNYKYHECDDADFIKACTLTAEDVANMSVDKNADVLPSAYFDYTETVPPGTPGTN